MKFHVSRNNHNNELHQVWKSACLSQNQRVYITSWLCALSPYLSQERDIRSSMPSRNCDLQRSLSHRCCGNRIIKIELLTWIIFEKCITHRLFLPYWMEKWERWKKIWICGNSQLNVARNISNKRKDSFNFSKVSW